MRLSKIWLCLSLALNASFTAADIPHGDLILPRQNSAAASSAAPLPTLSSGSAATSSAAASTSKGQGSSQPPQASSSATHAPSGTSNSTAAASTTIPSTAVSDANSSAAQTSSAPTSAPSNGTSSDGDGGNPLPLEPRITPAFAIAGVFLILTGVVYALIGVKNRWIHVFLSTAYLACLAVLVLIVYVMNPPVKDAIQGAYFVGIFMSGLIFGGGALVFKEVTEGLGCLLGGFCLSMWFLTLKSGGLITNTGGKAIFIAVFCVVCWSFSFSHYTRAYGLMFATSFSGSTAFVLGIDCFSKGGLKEFWVYIWNLNDNLFPLNTNTYPITRGTRVETVIIVLGTIIGMISQLRVWKVVQNRQKQRAEAEAEDIRRRDAVEEALGRHLERQNDRDRSEWEKRYGDRLSAKRNTVLWSETHGDKRLSSVSTGELDSSNNSASNESLEMAPLPSNSAMNKPPLHSSKSKRQSNISVQAIPEGIEEEDDIVDEKNNRHSTKPGENQSNYSEKLSFDQHPHTSPPMQELSRISSTEGQPQLEMSQSLRPQNSKPTSKKVLARLNGDSETKQSKKRSSVQSLNDLKRRSLQSIRSKSPAMGETTPHDAEFSESKEALLVLPPASNGTHSRASSVAATMDEENEKLEMPALDPNDNLRQDGRPPQIVISNSLGMNYADHMKSSGPPSPSALSESFEIDPEELVRPPVVKTSTYLDFGLDGNSRGVSGSHSEVSFEDGTKSAVGAAGSSNGEGLTRGALDRVPSQLSNVVLSYRTNEWAKHIATAEAPVFEEPDPIVLSDSEEPTHLADPVAQVQEKKVEFVEKPPPLPSPVTSVAPSEVGVKINPEIQPLEKALASLTADAVADPVLTTTLAEPAETVKALASPNLSSGMPSPNLDGAVPTSKIPSPSIAQRSFTDPAQSITPAIKSARRTSNPMQRQTSILHSTPIPENYATDFGSRNPGPSRTTSNASRVYEMRSPSSAEQFHPQQQYYPSAFKRTPSMTMHQNYSQPDFRPSSSQGQFYGMQDPSAMRSETRLAELGGRTHQPLQRNNTNESRRETLMADWRMQLANSGATGMSPARSAETRYTQQMMDYEADKIRKEQDRQLRARQEAAMDQSMRTQGMIDAHREVMRKMQNKANQKITK